MVRAVVAVAGAVLLLAGVACWGLLRGRLARRLLAEKHLLEIARNLDGVKKAACRQLLANAAAFAPTPNDPRVLATSAGLLVYWTVSRDGPAHAHQLSLSVVGGCTPRDAGMKLMLYLAGLLGVPYKRLELTVSPRSIHHALFILDEQEQADLQRRVIQPPRAARLGDLRREWSLFRQAARWRSLRSARGKGRSR